MSGAEALAAGTLIATAVELANETLGNLRNMEHALPSSSKWLITDLEIIYRSLAVLKDLLDVYRPSLTTILEIASEILKRLREFCDIIGKIFPRSHENMSVTTRYKSTLQLASKEPRLNELTTDMKDIIKLATELISAERLPVASPHMQPDGMWDRVLKTKPSAKARVIAAPRQVKYPLAQMLLRISLISVLNKDVGNQVQDDEIRSGEQYEPDALVNWIAGFAAEVRPPILHDGNTRVPKVQLIFVESGDDSTECDLTLPFTRGRYERLVDHLNIPPIMVAVLEQRVSRIEAWKSTRGDTRQGIVIRAPVSNRESRENWALSLGWDTKHTVVRGLVVGFHESDYSFLHQNRSRFDDMQHPLQIPLLLVESIISRDRENLRDLGESLVQVQTKMFVEGINSDQLLSKKTFDDMIRELNSAMSRLAFLDMRIRGFSHMMKRIRQFAIEEGNADQPNTDQSKTQSLVPELNRSLTNLCEETESLLGIVGYQQQHSQSLAELVYTMLQQHDNQTSLILAKASVDAANASIELAARAKADSTAMKALGIVSAIFLPGTFISALFSMGMFDWKAAPGGRVVSDRFWIYWAFTAPITVLLLICFFVFVMVREKQTKDERDENQGIVAVSIPDATPRFETAYQSIKRRRTMGHGEKTGHEGSGVSRLRLRRLWNRPKQNEDAVLPANAEMPQGVVV
ncbi:hypothetical protein Q7P37_008145 [Cladosporium fusiforme]